MLTDEQRAEIRRTASELIAHYRRVAMPDGGPIDEYLLTLLAVAEEVRRTATLEAASAGREAFRRKITGERVGDAAGCSRQAAARKWNRTRPDATPVAEDEPDEVLV